MKIGRLQYLYPFSYIHVPMYVRACTGVCVLIRGSAIPEAELSCKEWLSQHKQHEQICR